MVANFVNKRKECCNRHIRAVDLKKKSFDSLSAILPNCLKIGSIDINVARFECVIVSVAVVGKHEGKKNGNCQGIYSVW